jgi:hypothetical protein
MVGPDWLDLTKFGYLEPTCFQMGRRCIQRNQPYLLQEHLQMSSLVLH